MLLIYSYIFTFLDSVKAIFVHRANRLLSESTLILCTLRNWPGGRMPDPIRLPVTSLQGCNPRFASRFTQSRLQCYKGEGLQGWRGCRWAWARP